MRKLKIEEISETLSLYVPLQATCCVVTLIIVDMAVKQSYARLSNKLMRTGKC